MLDNVQVSGPSALEDMHSFPRAVSARGIPHEVVDDRPGGPIMDVDQARSNRSSSMTLAHAATKSVTNFSFASSLA